MASFFSKFAAASAGIRLSSLRRETAILAAAALMGALAAVLFAVDGYVLYRSHLRAPASVAPAHKGATLTEREIDEALLILDAREKKINAVLYAE